MGSPGGNPSNSSGRVTNRELYEALMKQNKERNELKDQLVAKIDGLCVSVGRQDERIKHNADEIKTIRNRSNIADIAIAIGAAVGTAISAVVGTRQ